MAKKKTKKAKSKASTRPNDANRYTSLSSHRRDKKRLIAPLNQMPAPVNRASWIDDRLPEFVWAALLAQALPREKYLLYFRSVVGAGQRHREDKAFISHNELAKLSRSDFIRMFAAIFEDQQARAALSPLLLIRELPDIAHWDAYLEPIEVNAGWLALAIAIAACVDHQSEAATDIRWLKVSFAAVQHRLQLPSDEFAEWLVGFPKVGDMRSVRPMIRSMEMALSAPDFVPASDWPKNFWKYCWTNTNCEFSSPEVPKSDFDNAEATRNFAETYYALAGHFLETNTTTAVDAKHDGAFGLALYAVTLVGSLFRPHSSRPAGRIVLRALVEVYITLAYLLKRDVDELWQKFRSYGSGQAKLAFLKITQSGGELPKYVSLDTLERMANDDAWQEFVDINVGHWAGIDLRRMSEEADVKDIYDLYYDWPSAFVHGQWPAIRNTVFTICGNPLHRFHRVPRPPRADLEDVSWDAVILGNKVLDLVAGAYPRFEPRLKATSKAPETPETDSDAEPIPPS